MDKRVKTILYIALFIVFMAAVGLAYNYLSNRYSPETPLLITDPEKTHTPPAQGPSESPAPTPGQSTESPTPTPEENPPESILAPDFVVVDSEGEEVKLSDYLGIPVVLNFWASWCSPCKSEMPHFNKVSEEYGKDELVFLMIDLVDGQRETVESGKKYVEENEFTFTVLFDTKQDAAATYGVRSIPSTLFIDKEGYIQAGVEGAIDEETLRRGIALIHGQ